MRSGKAFIQMIQSRDMNRVWSIVGLTSVSFKENGYELIVGIMWELFHNTTTVWFPSSHQGSPISFSALGLEAT